MRWWDFQHERDAQAQHRMDTHTHWRLHTFSLLKLGYYKLQDWKNFISLMCVTFLGECVFFFIEIFIELNSETEIRPLVTCRLNSLDLVSVNTVLQWCLHNTIPIYLRRFIIVSIHYISISQYWEAFTSLGRKLQLCVVFFCCFFKQSTHLSQCVAGLIDSIWCMCVCGGVCVCSGGSDFVLWLDPENWLACGWGPLLRGPIFIYLFIFVRRDFLNK